jgi:hypothetical protein
MWGALFSQLSEMLQHRSCLDGGAARDLVNGYIGRVKLGRRCFIRETWPIWPTVTREQCSRSNAGGGKVDLRMDSLALSNVLTWHFNLHVTKFLSRYLPLNKDYFQVNILGNTLCHSI